LLRAKGMTIAFAESCTGGLASSLVTDVPGSSEYLIGSVVSYTNQVKHEILGVPQETLDTYTAVSKETAIAMAEG
ncbi:CinA family protein, partial [Streptococcus salivarius]